jgi:MYXO-CTERM domain-containing protein
MSWKSIACVAALGAIAAPALALPTISVVDNGSGTGQINIITTAAGSIGAEISLVLSGATLGGATINSSIFDTANPGDNPFIAGSPVGGDTTGLSAVSGGTSIFASYGSGNQPAGTYKLLDFTYTGTGTATADGFVASVGVLTNVAAAVADIGEPDGPLGDTDGNGVVDLVDLNNVKNNFGGSTPPLLGDTDGNGNIDLVDLNNVKNNFGATASSAVSIPEPTSAAVALVGLVGLAARRRV